MSHVYTLNNCTILTVDAADHFYPAGRIVVEGKRIKAIGPIGEIPLQGEVVEMGGALIMPGLINTHTHSHSSIFRSLADDLALMDWLKTAIWPMESHLSHPRMHAAASLSYLEYLTSGITTVADQIYYADTVADAAAASGLRCFLAASVFSGSGPAPGLSDSLGQAKEFVEKWQGKEEETHVYPCIGPHAPYSVEGALFSRIVEYAEKKDLLIHVHISETQEENRQIEEKTGLSPTAWLHSLGVFSRPTLAAHSIHLSEKDIQLYAQNGVAASYNPISNLKLVSGIMPMKEMLDRGIVLAIGTDGAQSNNSMDLLRDLRTGMLIQKQQQGDATFGNARQAVRMATIEGARALRYESEIGSLEPGKRADLIALDATSPRLTPIHRERLDNLYSLVAYSTCGADVRDVMVDGHWLMQNRVLLRIHSDEICQRAQDASAQLLSASGR